MTTTRQFAVFAVIGVLVNSGLYGLYLVLTSGGVGHKAAMTSAFAAGVLSSFLLNRQWTFRHRGGLATSATRFASTYAIAYLVNVAVLMVLVDLARLPHEVVMLGLIVATAALTFVLQKHWVFDGESKSTRPP